MRWIRLLIYDGSEEYIRAAQAQSLPDGTRRWGKNSQIRSISILGGRGRALWQMLREVVKGA